MKEKNIFSSVKIVVITLICVKSVGFIKQAVIAAYFGTSSSIDKFLLVSELMENLGVAVFSSIAITFLTLYVDSIVKEGKVAANKFVSNIFVSILPLIILLIILLMCFSKQIAYIVAPGYSGEESQLISGYIKVFSVTMLNMFIFYISNAVLEAEKVFFPGKIVGVIRSICVIVAIIFLSNKIGINSMIIGVIAYYILEDCFIIFCARKKIKFVISKPFSDKRFKILIKLSIPLFVSYGTVQIQNIVDKAIASGLPAGSISALSYSGYLYHTTHSIIIGAICTVLFSFFTRYVAEGKDKLLLDTLYKYIRISVIVLMLVSILFIGYSNEIVSIVYQRGAFGQNSANNVSLAFSAYSIGLVFIGVRDIIIRAHYAYQNNRQAMINGVIGVIINITASIILSKVFGFVGVALATSISSFCIAVISCQTIKNNIAEFKILNLSNFFLKIILVGIILCTVMYFQNLCFDIENIVLDLCVKGIFDIVIYITLLRIFGFNEIKEIKLLIFNKLKKN